MCQTQADDFELNTIIDNHRLIIVVHAHKMVEYCPAQGGGAQCPCAPPPVSAAYVSKPTMDLESSTIQLDSGFKTLQTITLCDYKET